VSRLHRKYQHRDSGIVGDPSDQSDHGRREALSVIANQKARKRRRRGVRPVPLRVRLKAMRRLAVTAGKRSITLGADVLLFTLASPVLIVWMLARTARRMFERH
jgi:hypothetical protein